MDKAGRLCQGGRGQESKGWQQAGYVGRKEEDIDLADSREEAGWLKQGRRKLGENNLESREEAGLAEAGRKQVRREQSRSGEEVL